MKLLELDIQMDDAEHAFGTAEGSGEDLAATIRGYTEMIGPIAYMRQVHSDRIVYAYEPGCYEEADGIFTDLDDLWLAVSTADCAPVLLSCPHGVAAVHCGWRGLEKELLPKMIDTLIREFNITAVDISIHIGPCISQENYEVEESFVEMFGEKHFIPSDKKGKVLMDLRSIVTEQAREAGVPASHIQDSGLCTFHEKELFHSYRRSKKEGKESYNIQLSLVRKLDKS